MFTRVQLGGTPQKMPNFQMGCMAQKSSQTYRTYSPDGVGEVWLKEIASLVPY